MSEQFDPEHCREKAARIRAEASILKDEKRRTEMLVVAQHYEDLAVEIERFKRSFGGEQRQNPSDRSN